MRSVSAHDRRIALPANLLVLLLLFSAVFAACVIAPTEASMGHSQRIVYVHVAVAWMGLAGFPFMAIAGFLYLRRRMLAWDHWARAASEVSWICCSLTLVTGSLWAHEAWGTWWTWDPRLTTAFVLWVLYSGYLVVGRSLEDPHHRARIGAVLAIVGALEVPLVLFATRLFRGIHPRSPEAEPIMLLVLLVSVVGFSTFFVSLLMFRRKQLAAEQRLAEIEQHLDG
jgi:heme exporter protein C